MAWKLFWILFFAGAWVISAQRFRAYRQALRDVHARILDALPDIDIPDEDEREPDWWANFWQHLRTHRVCPGELRREREVVLERYLEAAEAARSNASWIAWLVFPWLLWTTGVLPLLQGLAVAALLSLLLYAALKRLARPHPLPDEELQPLPPSPDEAKDAAAENT